MRDLIVKKNAYIYAQIFYLVIVTSLNSISFFLARIQTQKKKFLKYNAHISNESQAFNELLFLKILVKLHHSSFREYSYLK